MYFFFLFFLFPVLRRRVFLGARRSSSLSGGGGSSSSSSLAEDAPWFIYTFTCQQINCLRSETDNRIVEGRIDDIRRVVYSIALSKHPRPETEGLLYPWIVSNTRQKKRKGRTHPKPLSLSVGSRLFFPKSREHEEEEESLWACA